MRKLWCWLFGLLGAFAVALPGCAPFSVNTDYAPTTNFARLHTYSWVAGDEANQTLALYGLPFLDRKIRAAVEDNLSAKGYVAVPAAQADFLMSYSILMSQEDVQTFSQFYRYKVEGGRENLSGAFADGFRQGTLVIDVLDPASQQLLWRGTAAAVADPEGKGDRAPAAVRAILARFPPK